MDLKSLIEKHQYTLLGIKRRLFFLKKFEEEISRKTKGKPFLIKNDIIFNLIIDSYDMLVIDFSSLLKGMKGRGGFFNKISAQLNTLNKSSNLTLLKKLFPHIDVQKRTKINQTDINLLKETFEKNIDDVIDDRDNNRAHRYQKDSEITTAPRLSVSKIEERFLYLENFFNAFRIVLFESSLAYPDLNMANSSEVANDLIDMVLWGSNKQIDELSGINNVFNKNTSNVIDNTYGYQLRNNLLELAHEWHAKPESCMKSFNAYEPAYSEQPDSSHCHKNQIKGK